MNLLKKILYILFLVILLPQFGQNKVQYDYFDWNFIQTKHFDIYYYGEGSNLIDFIAKQSEDAYDNHSSRMGWKLQNRIAIIIFNSHNDFQQNNVINTYMYEGISGVTELYKNRVVIPFDGSLKDFKHVLYHELVHAFINDYLYDGNLRNYISNPSNFQIPLWMNEGLAEYLSESWGTNSEMWIRDIAFNAREIPDISRLDGYLAYRGGQSVWRYIVADRGDEIIAEILRQLKNQNNLEIALKSSIGIGIKSLNTKWKEDLKSRYYDEYNIREDVDLIAKRLTDHVKIGNSYNMAPALSPDGGRIAIISNKSGNFDIYIISSDDGSIIKKIISGERSSEYEEMHILKPGISWSPDGRKIAFSAKSGKSDALFIYDISTSQVAKHRFELEGVFRPVWAPNKDVIAFIGNNGYSSDIYSFDLISEKLENKTNDMFSDDHVSWSSDGEILYFVSDRQDGLTDIEYIDVFQSDIFALDVQSLKVSRITNTPYNEQFPIHKADKISGQEYLAFISDQSGINNIYISNNFDISIFDAEQKKKSSNLIFGDTKPITNLQTGAVQIAWSQDMSQIIFTGFNNLGFDIFSLSNPIELFNKGNSIKKADWIEEFQLAKSSSKNSPTYQPQSSLYKNYVFSDFDESIPFDSTFTIKDIELSDSIILDTLGTYRVNKYNTRLTLDMAQAYYTFDSVYGSQGMAYFGFSDILGDHRFFIGTEMEVHLKDSDYFFMYNYLKRKIDWSIGVAHNAILYGTDYFGNYIVDRSRYRTLGIELGGDRPLSKFNRLEFQVNYNYSEQVDFSYSIIPGTNQLKKSEIDSTRKSFSTLVPSIKYVYDNASWSYTYPIDGMRMYLKFKHSPELFESGPSFNRVTLDFRKYYKISNGISLAGKLFGGTTWGESPLMFRVGGVPWIFSNDDFRINNGNGNLGIEDIYFSEYVMPVRGLHISEIFGDNVLLFNFELRLPFLIYYFPAIKYFGQLNGVMFVDLGAAWNSDFPNIFDESGWNSTLQSNRWIMSYGLGPRFIFLGYPWQLDFAWEYNPYIGRSDMKWYLSIGLDY